jgi:uncharacterized membrane protein
LTIGAVKASGQRRIGRVARLWARLRTTLWFLPTAIVVLSAAAAVLLSDVDPGTRLDDVWPLIFSARAEGTRQMLASIGAAMITVASVVLSVTIVALAQASSQYSPRVLRNFMRDVPTQLVLGSFVGCFGYCIIVLRTVRGGEDAYVPSLAAFVAMAYAFVAIALLIFFIHHVAQGIQAAFIVAKIQEETQGAIERVFPAREDERAAQAEPAPPEGRDWAWVEADASGYVTTIDFDALLDIARSSSRTVQVAVRPGDFVTPGGRLVAASGAQPLGARDFKRLRSAIVLARQRTIEQDPSFGVQQLVDVAVKALSPGVNDPTTACLCIDRLGGVFAQIAARADPLVSYSEEDGLRLTAPAQRFEELLQVAAPVLYHSRGDPQVLAGVLDAAERIRRACADDPRRLRALARLARGVQRALREGHSPAERSARRRAATLVRELTQPLQR